VKTILEMSRRHSGLLYEMPDEVYDLIENALLIGKRRRITIQEVIDSMPVEIRDTIKVVRLPRQDPGLGGTPHDQIMIEE
jgi:hypothetical protein